MFSQACLVRKYSPEENSRGTDPIPADTVANAHGVWGKSVSGPHDADIDEALMDKSAPND